MSGVRINPEAMKSMREKGGTWAAYENQVLDSRAAGHLIFLRFGPGCTYEVPPASAPDGTWGTGWKYRLIGTVDLETGEVNAIKERLDDAVSE